ncbi:MAG: iron-sulfur cluster assembly accessory protein [Bacteroidetes bacterium]|nr:MAG: iron-sulfur cluster assembly accessory protein [Bacteroidota bacterium]
MTEITSTGVILTESAARELKAIRDRDQVSSDKKLRVGVKGGGCSGMSYILDFDQKGDFDDELEINGLQVLVDRRHALYIMGMEVDFQSGLNDRGFVFINPNAKTTCGCGTSFST